ncbi:MAG: hypothetical protein U9N41_00815 [Euryarchaeota archaeon]|nr:hypothetical protein [Euryarchaeota archaeon]
MTVINRKIRLGIADWVARICLVGAVVCLTTLMPMVGAAQAEAGTEGEGINETAFWAFVTIALTVVVSVIITSIFHYLSTRELRKMGTEIAVEKPFLTKKSFTKRNKGKLS